MEFISASTIAGFAIVWSACWLLVAATGLVIAEAFPRKRDKHKQKPKEPIGEHVEPFAGP